MTTQLTGETDPGTVDGPYSGAGRAPLPAPRGPVSARVVEALRGPEPETPIASGDVGRNVGDDALALWVLDELHYRGLDGVDDRWEWSPAIAGLWRRLQDDLEVRLLDRWAAAGAAADVVGAAAGGNRATTPTEVAAAITALVAADDGPSLARHVQKHATHDQVCELLRQRSVYHLKEADPTAWVVPRLPARPKAALMAVQYDEYGAGDPARLHHRLFERGMAASGLDTRYGRYVDEASTETLEQNNTLSLFGLRRRWRAAALGHFAAFEATSSVPSRQLAQGLTRLGFPAELVGYYDEHVEADAVHDQLAMREVCGTLVQAEPALLDDVLFGAWTCLDLEGRTAHAQLARWGVPS